MTAKRVHDLPQGHRCLPQNVLASQLARQLPHGPLPSHVPAVGQDVRGVFPHVILQRLRIADEVGVPRFRRVAIETVGRLYANYFVEQQSRLLLLRCQEAQGALIDPSARSAKVCLIEHDDRSRRRLAKYLPRRGDEPVGVLVDTHVEVRQLCDVRQARDDRPGQLALVLEPPERVPEHDSALDDASIARSVLHSRCGPICRNLLCSVKFAAFACGL
mmetsp:Transcript_68232/g.209251  ORF Transcript_68232/g.209251 Transcript_68232/m.209251 type:complete len:217 (+) Transcript_68232:139-789(+)